MTFEPNPQPPRMPLADLYHRMVDAALKEGALRQAQANRLLAVAAQQRAETAALAAGVATFRAQRTFHRVRRPAAMPAT